MSDTFSNYKGGLESPATGAFTVTPSDAVDLAVTVRALYIGVGGDVKVTTVNDSTVTFVGCPAGLVLPVRVKKVFAVGSTATNIIGLY